MVTFCIVQYVFGDRTPRGRGLVSGSGKGGATAVTDRAALLALYGQSATQYGATNSGGAGGSASGAADVKDAAQAGTVLFVPLFLALQVSLRSLPTCLLVMVMVCDGV